MLKQERHEIIMDLICQQHNVRVTELKTLLSVSDETVRRDLAELEKQGLLRCVHGGAVYDSPTTKEYQIELRIQKHQAEKEAICKKTAELINEGDSLAITSSTTTWALGALLAKKNHLTIVTNSIFIANQAASNSSNSVILTGGTLWPREQKMMGALAGLCFRQYHVDKALISVGGVSPVKGLSDYNEAESELTKAVMESGRSIILLCDSSKFGAVAFQHMADIGRVSEIVTDAKAQAQELAPYEALGIRVHRAQV